jgi:YjbE family integral membrane protein
LPERLDTAHRSAYVSKVPPNLADLSALVSVVIIDVVLAGDNAIVVGMAAAGLTAARRRGVIALGIVIATVLRILLALFTMKLLEIIGLALAGGVLLLWVAWKLFRELHRHALAPRPPAAPGSSYGMPAARKSGAQALGQIILADVSMSLDNVLALAGTARAHPWILSFGLLLSVALMGVASHYIARLLARHFWISWIGLALITLVALRMVWEGSNEVIRQAAAQEWAVWI